MIVLASEKQTGVTHVFQLAVCHLSFPSATWPGNVLDGGCPGPRGTEKPSFSRSAKDTCLSKDYFSAMW